MSLNDYYQANMKILTYNLEYAYHTGHLFITQQMIINDLLYARHCARHWVYWNLVKCPLKDLSVYGENRLIYTGATTFSVQYSNRAMHSILWSIDKGHLGKGGGVKKTTSLRK